MLDLRALPNHERDEVTVLFLRRHWIDVVKIFLFTALLLLVPAAVLALLSYTGSSLFAQPFWGPVATLVLATYLLVVVSITHAQFTDYFLDVWIVTNERVIDIEQRGLFSRTISEMRLNQVQDITSEMQGFLGTFLTFGDVHVQSAAERIRFHFKNIDNPDDVKLTIARLVAECKRRHGDASGGNIEEQVEETNELTDEKSEPFSSKS